MLPSKTAVLLLLMSCVASAQTSPPLSLAQSPATVPSSEPAPRLRSWEMAPIMVVGQKPAELAEEEFVGSYGQPRWTATRRFTASRVYVIPEGKIDVEYWAIPRFFKDGTADVRSLYEVEFGLPHRFQIDLYLRTDQETPHLDRMQLGGQYEIRYALADWGQIPGNPTLYFEYMTLENRADRIEPKLLLGDTLAPRWHWSVNLVWERELSGPCESELELTSGLSYSVIDSCFSIGPESVVNLSNTRENRSSYETTVLLGPSFQYKPFHALTINFAPLFGLTEESPVARAYLNVGWEF